MGSLEIIVMSLGYVALLLWGVRMVRTGITRSFTSEVRHVIAVGASSRLRAAAVGVGITALIQSSTAMCLIVSSFVARELLTLPVALAIMLGADVGTTIAALIFSIDLSWLPALLFAVGVILFLSTDNDRRRSIGRVLIGLGLMLLSIRLLGQATADLRTSPGFLTVMTIVGSQPLLAAIVAGLVTWLAHSSLAIVLLVMSLAISAAISIPLAVALVVGANAGGAIAPYVDQSGGLPAARRVALGNLIMRGSMAVIAIAALYLPWLWLVEWFGLRPGAAVLATHLVFNLLTAVVFLPFTERTARLASWLIADQAATTDLSTPRYLDATALESPSEALALATRETLSLGDIVLRMLESSIDVFEKNDARLMKEIEKQDDSVDRLHEAIKLYLVRLSATGLAASDSRRYVETLTFITNLEHVGDIIDKNLMDLGGKKIRNHYTFSREGFDELRQFHRRVADNMKLALNVFTSRDVRLARKLLAEKTLLREAELQAASSHYARLQAGRTELIETSSIHLDVIRDLKRINSHVTSVAYPILEETGELLVSRLRFAGSPLIEARAETTAAESADDLTQPRQQS